MNRFILLLLIISLIACKNEVSLKDLEKKDGLLLYNQKPYTGKVLNKSVNDTIIEIYGVKKGLKEGEYLKYHQNGTIEIKGYYASGQMDSVWNYYYKNGTKELEVNLSEGELNGKFMKYNHLGNLEVEIENIKGKIEQEDSIPTSLVYRDIPYSLKYNKSGLKKRFKYSNDSLYQGYSKTFYNDNILLSDEWGDVLWIEENDTIWIAKKITKYFPNTRQKKYQAQFLKGDNNDSLYLRYEFTTIDADNAKDISYFENGKTEYISNYKILKSKDNQPYDVVRDGQSLTYNNKGKLLKTENYKNGKLVVKPTVSNYSLVKGIYKMKKDGSYYNFYLFLNKNGIAVLNAGLKLTNPKYGKYTFIGNKVKVNWQDGGSFQGDYSKNSGAIKVSSTLSWVFYDNL